MQQHSRRRRRLRRRLALRQGVQQLGDVQAAIGAHHRIDARRLQADLGEGPCRAEHAPELEIDEEAIEAEQRPPVGLLQAELPDIDFEQQRVDPDLADLRAPPELLVRVARHVRRDEPGNEEEPGQRVDEEESREHGERDDDPPAREPYARPSPSFSPPGCHAAIVLDKASQVARSRWSTPTTAISSSTSTGLAR